MQGVASPRTLGRSRTSRGACGPYSSRFSSTLPSGAKIFVPPEVLESVVQHLKDEGLELKTSHIVYAQELEWKIKAVITTARGATTRSVRGSFKLEAQTEVNVPLVHDIASQALALAEPDDPEPAYIAKQTFIHVSVHGSDCEHVASHMPAAGGIPATGGSPVEGIAWLRNSEITCRETAETADANKKNQNTLCTWALLGPS